MPRLQNPISKIDYIKEKRIHTPLTCLSPLYPVTDVNPQWWEQWLFQIITAHTPKAFYLYHSKTQHENDTLYEKLTLRSASRTFQMICANSWLHLSTSFSWIRGPPMDISVTSTSLNRSLSSVNRLAWPSFVLVEIDSRYPLKKITFKFSYLKTSQNMEQPHANTPTSWLRSSPTTSIAALFGKHPIY